MRNFLEAIAENEDDYDFYNYGENATVESVLNDLYSKGDFEMLQDVNATAIGDLVAATELFNEVNSTKYDGIILPTETVVFNSNQIKSATDNVGTFDKNNPDVRYSREFDADLFDVNEDIRKRISDNKEQKSRSSKLRLFLYFGISSISEEMPLRERDKWRG